MTPSRLTGPGTATNAVSMRYGATPSGSRAERMRRQMSSYSAGVTIADSSRML